MIQVAFRIEKREYDLALRRAEELGIPFSRYLRRLLRHDLHIIDIETNKELAEINAEVKRRAILVD